MKKVVEMVYLFIFEASVTLPLALDYHYCSVHPLFGYINLVVLWRLSSFYLETD